jgi:hypothetical protein
VVSGQRFTGVGYRAAFSLHVSSVDDDSDCPIDVSCWDIAEVVSFRRELLLQFVLVVRGRPAPDRKDRYVAGGQRALQITKGSKKWVPRHGHSPL